MLIAQVHKLLAANANPEELYLLYALEKYNDFHFQ